MSDYLIGGSPVIKRIKASLTKLSADTSPLVITGEPGVGKSLLSSRIHANSLLKDRPLESINFQTYSERDQRIRLLGGSPPELPTSRRSVLEMPTTVVLKHIDFATKYLQERLAEAIPKKEIIRLGTKDKRSIRCRLIFVLNDSPYELYRRGSLISGLSKILSKYQFIELPPLKKRKEDIPELAQHFFTQFQIQRRKQIDHNFIKLLQRNRWNENILELKSFIKTYDMPSDEIAIQQKDRIELAKMNLMIDEGTEFSLKDSVSRIEKTMVRQALKKYADCQAKAAQSIGLTDRAIRFISKT
ncbi:MAG: sigma 54-interacting transcriptional regulator [Bacteroidota bacterium]